MGLLSRRKNERRKERLFPLARSFYLSPSFRPSFTVPSVVFHPLPSFLSYFLPSFMHFLSSVLPTSFLSFQLLFAVASVGTVHSWLVSSLVVSSIHGDITVVACQHYHPC